MKTIMLIEDDPGIRDVIQIILKKQGYNTILYSNGDDLFNNAFITPDLFILDKQLSGVDGLDICRFLKGRDETKGIPVIMLSASPHIHRLAMSAGADDAIEKPFQLSMFKEVVAKHLT
jgi:DNA-binding response OmpR family regulator